MYELALFAGAGGGILGGILRDHAIVGAVEIEDYPRRVLLQRQRDGILPEFPIWNDVTTFRIDNPETREYIELLRTIRAELVISGGFPCQDISIAGKGMGIVQGSRSGLWYEFARIIGEIRPRYAFVENSPMLTVRGGTGIIADLAVLGYDAKWGIIGGHAAGLCANGDRLWIVANATDCKRREPSKIQTYLVDPDESRRRQFGRAIGACTSEDQHAGMLRNPNELARAMDRIKSVGNGQMPILVELAWEMLG